MPYIGEEREKELMADPTKANLPGDYNALYTMAFLNAFITDPCYRTLHEISRCVLNPERESAIGHTLTEKLIDMGVPFMDIWAAMQNAYLEFYTRVGHPYENMARMKNGDLQLYKDAGAVLHGLAMGIAEKMATGDK